MATVEVRTASVFSPKWGQIRQVYARIEPPAHVWAAASFGYWDRLMWFENSEGAVCYPELLRRRGAVV